MPINFEQLTDFTKVHNYTINTKYFGENENI